MLFLIGMVGRSRLVRQSRAAFCKVITTLMWGGHCCRPHLTLAPAKPLRISKPRTSIYCSWNFDSSAIPD